MNIAREFGSEIDRVSFHWAIAIKLIPVGFCLFEDDKFRLSGYLMGVSINLSHSKKEELFINNTSQ